MNRKPGKPWKDWQDIIQRDLKDTRLTWDNGTFQKQLASITTTTTTI